MKSLLFLFRPPERSDFIQPHGWKPQDTLTQTAESSPTAAAPCQIPLARGLSHQCGLPLPPGALQPPPPPTPHSPPPTELRPRYPGHTCCLHTYTLPATEPCRSEQPVSLISTAILFLEPLNLKELPNIVSPVTEIWP